MKADRGISLLDELRDSRASLALVGSYNVYFPFFEQVVLRKLRASGCGYVVLMMDAGQLSAAMQAEETRPRLAGLEYGLLPVQAPGAFHPKFLLLAGKDRSRLVVGSHNVTLAGFGLNKEITTLFEAGEGGNARAPFRTTWRFARDWAAGQHKLNLELLQPFERLVPWLGEDPGDDTSEGAWVAAAGRSGPSLWEQLQPHLAHDVASVTLLGPSFDDALAFVRTVEKELAPKELVVGVDPDSAGIPADAKMRHPKVRFVDLVKGRWKGSHSHVHAKVLRCSLRGGGELLVTGSANPSRQAWLAPGPERNAELVVVQRVSARGRLSADLGLDRIPGLPEVSAKSWKAIDERRKAREEAIDDQSVRVEVAVSVVDGFLVSKAFGARASAGDYTLIAFDASRHLPDGVEVRGEDVLVRFPNRGRRDSIAFLKVARPAGEATAIVQHVERLLDEAQDDTRRALRNALAGLEGDPTQLEEVFRLVESALSVVPDNDASRTLRSRGKRSAVTLNPGDENDLEAALADTPVGRRVERARAESDLAALLDVLIFRLGPVMSRAADAAPGREGEGELADEDDPEPEEESVHGYRMAEWCRKRAHRLTNRLMARLEEAAETQSAGYTSLARLAGALSVVHFIRSRELTFAWRPPNEALVDDLDLKRLLDEGSRLFFARPHGIESRARKGQEPGTAELLSKSKALLCWLAFDCGDDLDGKLVTEEDEEGDSLDVGPELAARASLIQVVSETLADASAGSYLAARLGEYAEGADWLDRQTRFISRLRASRERTDAPVPAGDLQTGDIVCATTIADSPFTVVLWANGQKAAIVDLNTGNEKQFVSRYLKLVERPRWLRRK